MINGKSFQVQSLAHSEERSGKSLDKSISELVFIYLAHRQNKIDKLTKKTKVDIPTLLYSNPR